MSKTAKKEDWEFLDINDLITGGKKGILAYTVTGDSMREDIKPGSVIFTDPSREAQKGDVIVLRQNGRNCVRVYEENQQKGLYLVVGNKPHIQPKPDGADKNLGVAVGYVGFC